jgi:mono/diheme cytochrome c family protein
MIHTAKLCADVAARRFGPARSGIRTVPVKFGISPMPRVLRRANITQMNNEESAVQVLRPLLLALTAVSLAACAGTRTGSDAAPPQPQTQSIERGMRQFRVSCSGCHGPGAHGNGPIAPLLAVAVPDLTQINSRHGGQFPADEVYRIIDGQADLTAHGPRHMPVWGYEFFGDEPDDEAAHRQATRKIERVVAYLRSIQRVP